MIELKAVVTIIRNMQICTRMLEYTDDVSKNKLEIKSIQIEYTKKRMIVIQ